MFAKGFSSFVSIGVILVRFGLGENGCEMVVTNTFEGIISVWKLRITKTVILFCNSFSAIHGVYFHFFYQDRRLLHQWP